MLKITVDANSGSTVLKLEGKLAGPWVEELEKSWNSVALSPQARRLSVDLCGVTFVDIHGKLLLTKMHLAGVDLAGDGVMTRYLIEKIEHECNGHKREETRHEDTIRNGAY
jgi:hypothetical protein